MTDDLLEELLNLDDDKSFIDEEDRKLLPLKREISFIENEPIRNFVRAILYSADAFWRAPSTSSKGFHPPDEMVAGGCVLHTKRVVRIARTMCISQERNQHELDILTAAALIHDVTKTHQIKDDFSFDAMHPYTLDHFVAVVMGNEEKHLKDKFKISRALEIDHDDCASILRLVRCHMGPWSPIPETFPITLMEWMMHFADVVATQLHVMVDGEEVKEWRWIETDEGCGTEVLGEDIP